jgi:hypothetical protein
MISIQVIMGTHYQGREDERRAPDALNTGRQRRRFKDMEPIRISPQEARKKLQAGEILLVCAYEDAEKFQAHHLEGALSFSEFQSRLPSLSRSQEIVFYCA